MHEKTSTISPINQTKKPEVPQEKVLEINSSSWKDIMKNKLVKTEAQGDSNFFLDFGGDDVEPLPDSKPAPAVAKETNNTG